MFEEIWANPNSFSIAVLSSIVATALWSAVNLIFYARNRVYREQRFRANVAWWLRLTFILALSLLASVYIFTGNQVRLVSSIAGVASFGLIASLIKLYKLAKIGIYDFDVSVRSGFNYDAALKAASNNIFFLGPGAYKLTSSDEFETAITGCQMGVTNRFLLVHPDSDVLRTAAKQAGVAEDSYANKVRDSIEKLARLAASRKFNIQVRFQDANREDDLESFRMMFIDQRFCLLSFNAYGKGDGSALPQLIIQSKSRVSEEKSLYHGCSQYFERRWGAAKPWSMQEFLGGGGEKK